MKTVIASGSPLNHTVLEKSLRKAYSAEKAASLAYIGHARSLRDATEVARIKRIEADEWAHRREVGKIMARHGIKPSWRLEISYTVIGTLIGWSCSVIGRFMPYFFAGKLESGNVCEYFVMIRHFHALGINDYDEVLHEMGMKEKGHEVYFLELIANEPWLPWFERLFAWGKSKSANDVDLSAPPAAGNAHSICQRTE